MLVSWSVRNMYAILRIFAHTYEIRRRSVKRVSYRAYTYIYDATLIFMASPLVIWTPAAAAGAKLITIHISVLCSFMMITVISH